MSSPIILPLRSRDTRATRRRLDNMRNIITALAGSEMDAVDICVQLDCTPSGGRKYLTDLTSIGAIQIARTIGTGRCARVIYQLVPDTDRIDAILDEIEARLHLPPSAGSAVSVSPAVRKTIHVMGGDAPLSVKPTVVVIRRDPLVEALFGPAAQTQIEVAP